MRLGRIPTYSRHFSYLFQRLIAVVALGFLLIVQESDKLRLLASVIECIISEIDDPEGVGNEVESANLKWIFSDPRIYPHIAHRITSRYWQLVPVKFAGNGHSQVWIT